MPGNYTTYLLAATALATVAGVAHPAVRQALERGAGCLGRYPDAWRVPALFGLTYGLYRAAATVLVLVRSDEDVWRWANDFGTQLPLPDARDIFGWTWRSALETTGSTFHVFTLTFPVSALLAIRFLLNVDGIFGALLAALRLRLPRGGVWLLVGLTLSAIAAVVKPFVTLFLPELTAIVPQVLVLVGGAVLNYSALPFELLLGFFLLTYFLLIARLWRRGSQLDHHELIHLSCRRLGYVAKWALVFLCVAFVLVVLPNVAANVVENTSLSSYLDTLMLPPFSAFLLATALVPITLVFRNLSLAAALAAAFRFLASNLSAVILFLVFASSTNLILSGAGVLVNAVFGYESITALTVRCVLAIAEGTLAGWLVVSWACLYESRIPVREPATGDSTR